MSCGVRNIEINPEFLYHRVTADKIDRIILAGGIYARRYLKSEIKKERGTSWNGDYYISLAKYQKGVDLSYDSCYRNFIQGQYAFVIQDIDAIPTRHVDSYFQLYQKLANLPIKRRYSHYIDEYQVKGKISLSHVVGIKIPSKNLVYSYLCPSYIDSNRGIDYFLEKMESVGGKFPFIDVEEEKIIEKENIKEYIKGWSYE